MATKPQPTLHLLQAAVFAARLINADGSPLDELLTSFGRVPSGGLYNDHHLRSGQMLLERARLVTVENGVCHPTPTMLELAQLPIDVAAEALYFQLLEAERPLWLFRMLDTDALLPEDIPIDEGRLLKSLFHDEERREALLLAAARRFDEARQRELGALGEEHVVSECRAYLLAADRPDLADQVQRLSLVSDELGYDVTSPDLHGRRHRLEVKTTTGIPGRVRFYLSRNEYTVGLDDLGWSLVVVRLDVESKPHVVGWISGAGLEDVVPHDADAQPGMAGRWESVRIKISDDRLTPGLPVSAPRL